NPVTRNSARGIKKIDGPALNFPLNFPRSYPCCHVLIGCNMLLQQLPYLRRFSRQRGGHHSHADISAFCTLRKHPVNTRETFFREKNIYPVPGTIYLLVISP